MPFRGRVALAVIAGSLALAAPASAEITSVFDGAIPCTPQKDGTRYCGGPDTRVPTFDGLRIDVNVALPPAPKKGPDGPYPLVMVFHGYGGSELGQGTLGKWAKRGYAAFSMSDRGFGRSCGGKDQLLEPGCEQGHVRLMDTRYEVRDAQTFAGILADEGVVKPKKIGATGGSYGGGMSMALAALRNRVMLEDGSLVPWKSPGGKRMAIAAATPEIPWTDLANSLMPNGATLDYVADAPYGERIGVLKLTFVAGLFAGGLLAGKYAVPGTDPKADLITWYAVLNAGEPYDSNPMAVDVLEQAKRFHSSYYIDHSIKPAPLLISNGWTDDIFPPDEAIRFYNRTRTQFPKADISLFFLDYGHQRGQNKDADVEVLQREQTRWFAHYLKGKKRKLLRGVEVLTQTCPKEVSSEGPYRAKSWAKIARGEVRLSAPAKRTMAPVVLEDAGLRFDPIAGPGACTQTDADRPLGSVDYDIPVKRSFTLLGSPTVIADVNSPGPYSQVAARLLDVAPNGRQTLVARGLWRAPQGSGRHVFQLHPNGYRFAPGHVARLQLLPADIPYSRPTIGQQQVEFSTLKLRLPVRQKPGGAVKRPAPKFVPDGYKLAREFRQGR